MPLRLIGGPFPPWSLNEKTGRVCEVGLPTSGHSCFTLSLFALCAQRAILLCEAGRLPPSDTEARGKAMGNTTRKGSTPIKVWVLPEEKELIEANAKTVGKSVSSYLRTVGIGLEVKSLLDHRAVGELAKVNADLGRLGGLLKMWLTNDEKLAIHDRTQLNQTILGVLQKIGEIQRELLERAKRI